MREVRQISSGEQQLITRLNEYKKNKEKPEIDSKKRENINSDVFECTDKNIKTLEHHISDFVLPRTKTVTDLNEKQPN